MGHNGKTKHKTNRDKRLRDPAQRHRKYIQQIHRRKLFQPKEGYPYEGSRNVQNNNRLDKNVPLSCNNRNTKHTKQRKNVHSVKGKRQVT